MVDVNIHWRVEVRDHRPPVLSRSLVTRVDGAHLPVGPVDPVVEERDGERMLERFADDRPASGPVEVAAVDVAQLSVGPVDLLRLVVEGQSVGPEDLGRDEDLAEVR